MTNLDKTCLFCGKSLVPRDRTRTVSIVGSANRIARYDVSLCQRHDVEELCRQGMRSRDHSSHLHADTFDLSVIRGVLRNVYAVHEFNSLLFETERRDGCLVVWNRSTSEHQLVWIPAALLKTPQPPWSALSRDSVRALGFSDEANRLTPLLAVLERRLALLEVQTTHQGIDQLRFVFERGAEMVLSRDFEADFGRRDHRWFSALRWEGNVPTLDPPLDHALSATRRGQPKRVR